MDVSSFSYLTGSPFFTLPGDSGSPLLADTSLGFGAIGLNSFGNPGSFSAALSIGTHRDFIDAEVSDVAWLGAVPEPSTFLLLAVGLGGLATWGRRSQVG